MTTKASIDFYTFGAGLSRYKRASRRLATEAKLSTWFRNSYAWSVDDLSREFRSLHQRVLQTSVRGFGYWIWKSHLIAEALSTTDAEFVCFLDAGCVLNFGSSEAGDRFYDYVDFAYHEHLMTVSMPHLSEKCWTKGDVLHEFSLSGPDRDSGQRQGGVLLIRNSEMSRDLVDLWHQLSVRENYRLVDDSQSRTPSDPCFIAHRHDQSILSCLTKAHGLKTVELDETFHAPDWSEAGRDFPFWAPRHLYGSAFDPRGLTGRQRIARLVGAAEKRAHSLNDRRTHSKDPGSV